MACVCDGLNIQLELVCLVDDCVRDAFLSRKVNRNDLKLLTVDILALATMKNAAKCDT